MRRLYLQIYATLLAILLPLGLLATVAWWLLPDRTPWGAHWQAVAGVVAEILPPDAPPAATQARLERLARPLGVAATLRDPSGRLVAAAGPALPPPRTGTRTSFWRPASSPAMLIALPDGRSLALAPLAGEPGMRFGFFGFLLVLAVAVAIGAWPLVRRLTRRLERLNAQVTALGQGDLSARVTISGQDEVAALARSFNRAAERIEQLVQAERNTLAFASHELRTPLARLRLAVELLPGTAERPELKARIESDIRALDDLIEELLLASRLKSATAPLAKEPVDLLALAAEETAGSAVAVSGGARLVQGDARLLRRLLRNLLENARRYGGEGPIAVEIAERDGQAVLAVLDRGAGVPEAERERIFEPFYRRAEAAQHAAGGMGLGLALVRAIARRHGGEVHYLPRDGGGSRFEVTLPAG